MLGIVTMRRSIRTGRGAASPRRMVTSTSVLICPVISSIALLVAWTGVPSMAVITSPTCRPAASAGPPGIG